METPHDNHHHDDDDDDDRKPAAVDFATDHALPPMTTRNDNDDDDEEDNWSRQVEMDETTNADHHHHHNTTTNDTDSLVVINDEDEDASTSSSNRDKDTTANPPPPQPSHRELTLKERLVVRERQRRIEAERARLKRRFVQSGVIADDDDDDDDEDDNGSNVRQGASGDDSGNHHPLDTTNDTANGRANRPDSPFDGGGGGGGDVDIMSATEGTLGEESTRAHYYPDEESAAAEENRLGFNMERFLRNSDTFNPQLEPMAEDREALMKRFLKEPVVVEPPVVEETNEQAGGQGDSVQRTVSFDVDGLGGVRRDTDEGGQIATDIPSSADPIDVPAESFVSFGDDTANMSTTNVSIQVEADEEDLVHPLTPMTSLEVHESASQMDDMIARSTTSSVATPSVGGNETSDEPRVLRLTEADMQEMAAIDEASIGNAPPSEREEEMLDEIGELADFGGSVGPDPLGTLSQGTPTTAQDSASLISGGNHSRSSARPTSAASMDRRSADQGSLDGMPGTASYSSNPAMSPGAVSTAVEAPSPVRAHDVSMVPQTPVDGVIDGVGAAHAVEQPTLGEEPGLSLLPSRREVDVDSTDKEKIVNRVLRPGMINFPAQAQRPRSSDEEDGLGEPVVVEGFDFDKDEPTSPLPSIQNDSFRDLPPDVWSPTGKMQVSPIAPKGRSLRPLGELPEYPDMSNNVELRPGTAGGRTMPTIDTETTPLLRDDVPPEITTSGRMMSDDRVAESSRRFSIISDIQSVFSDVRSEEELSKAGINNESEHYLASSIFARGKN